MDSSVVYSAPDPDTAASGVERLASDPRYGPRSADLHDLATSLRSEDGRESWDQVDLLTAFPPESTIRVAFHSQVERVLGLAAVIGVFLPVAWTWYSLQQASQAYGRLISDGEGDGESFLQLWVTGFAGRLSAFHQLTTVAAVSVGLILLAVLLIVLHRWAANRARHAEETHYHEAETRLVSTLVVAQRSLVHPSATDFASIESMVRKSARELRGANEATQESTRLLNQSLEQAQTSLATILSDMSGITHQVQQSLATLASTSGQMTSAAKSAEAAAAQAVSSLSQSVDHAAQRYQQANSQAFAATEGALTAAAAALQTAQADLKAAVSGLGQASSALPGQVGAGVQASVGNATAQLNTIAAAVRSDSEVIARVVSELDGIMMGNQSATQAQATELTQTRAALEMIRAELAGIASAAGKQRVGP